MTLLPLVSDLYMHYAVFRCVLWTSEHSQFVVMTGASGGQLEEEVCKRDIVHKDPNTDEVSQVHTVDQHSLFTTGALAKRSKSPQETWL